MNECTFIIFGITGDLTKRKLIPALCKLIEDQKISKFIVIGIGQEDTTVADIFKNAREFNTDITSKIWQVLQEHAHYEQLDVNTDNGFKKLATKITSLEQQYNLAGNRLVHLAVPSFLFCQITKQIGNYGIVCRSDEQGYVNAVWQRIIYEKPFGINAQSAHKVNKCIDSFFSPYQVYRIDHYLTKELVASILLVRFTNMIFQPLWNRKYIEHVQIVMTEEIGTAGRGGYYDSYGILKDVVQNHAMQLLSLIAMELPAELDAQHIQKAKTEILKNMTCVDGLLGQYADYTQEPGVHPDSTMPTFAALTFTIHNEFWRGVPFYIKSGKKLGQKNTSIHIKFKEVPCTLRERCFYTSNYLSIRIAPKSEFVLQLNTKKPRSIFEAVPIDLTFNHDYMFGAQTPEAYELLYERVMEGDQSIAVSSAEIEYAWAIIEHIEHKNLPLYIYKPGNAPTQLELFEQEHGMKWKE